MKSARLALVLITAMTIPMTKAHAAPLCRLPNGLRYLVLENHAMPVISLQIWVRCGAVNEVDYLLKVPSFSELLFSEIPHVAL